MDSIEQALRNEIDRYDHWLADILAHPLVWHDDPIARNSAIRQRHRAIQELQQRQLERMLAA